MVTLTDRAAEAVRAVFEQEGVPDAALRLYVAGGGCSGLQYGMAIEDTVEQSDHVFESKGIRIVVDEISHPFMDGSEVDYVEGPEGTGFTISNPNVIPGCGGCAGSCAPGEEPPA